MKVLVTDFDGTLCNTHSDDIDIESNVEALKRFQKAGNIIVISTAREPKSMAKYINKYDIPCDYVISYMGALIWDCKSKEYIYARYFSNSIAKKILNIVEPYKNRCEFEIYSIVENPQIDQHIGYIFHKEKDIENDVFDQMNNSFGRSFESIIDNKDYKNIDFFTRYLSEEYFFINNTKNTKLLALDFLIEHLLKQGKIKKDTPIYTIGDGLDDYEMLKKYNGYRIKKSDEELTKRYSKEIESVKTYVNMILSNEIGD